MPLPGPQAVRTDSPTGVPVISGWRTAPSGRWLPRSVTLDMAIYAATQHYGDIHPLDVVPAICEHCTAGLLVPGAPFSREIMRVAVIEAGWHITADHKVYCPEHWAGQ